MQLKPQTNVKEYAKFVRVAPTSSSTKGFQVTLKLPSSKALVGQEDYINFYCGLHGLECGISTKNHPDFKVGGALKWRWFVNGTSKATGSPEYSDGSTITLLLAIDESQNNRIVFKVNGVQKFISPESYSAIDNSRLIIAALQAVGIKRPLAAWKLTHAQVTASAMKYKTSNNTWQNITNNNAAWDKFNAPTDQATFPAIQNYTVSPNLASSTIYASIK